MDNRRAFRSPSAWMLLLTILISTLAFDLASKAVAFRDIDLGEGAGNTNWTPPPQPPVEILPAGLFNFQLVINRGAVFGIGANQRFFFIVFTIAALATGLLLFGRMTRANDRRAHLAISLILAGGIGNLVDRVMYGFVRDFLHLFPGLRLPFGWRWPGGSPEMFPWVFNVADVLLLIGMAMLVMHMGRLEKQRAAERTEAQLQEET